MTSEVDSAWRKSTPPLGSVKLSAAALVQVKAFMHEVRRREPLGDWIAAIGWATGQRKKGPYDIEWRDLPDGVELGVFPRGDVPHDVVEKIGEIEIVFYAPDPAIFAGKTIDLRDGQFFIGMNTSEAGENRSSS